MKIFYRKDDKTIELEQIFKEDLGPLFLCSDVDEVHELFDFQFCPICGSREIIDDVIIHIEKRI